MDEKAGSTQRSENSPLGARPIGYLSPKLSPSWGNIIFTFASLGSWEEGRRSSNPHTAGILEKFLSDHPTVERPKKRTSPQAYKCSMPRSGRSLKFVGISPLKGSVHCFRLIALIGFFNPQGLEKYEPEPFVCINGSFPRCNRPFF